MRAPIFFILSIIINLSLSAQDENLRIIRGSLTSDGHPLIGEPIRILGTTNGTVTNLKGEFCLLAPASESIFISMPQCFESVVREIQPDTDKVKVKLKKRNKSITEKAQNNWKLQEEELGSKLRDIFGKFDYQERIGEICR